jgi:hypothetical protein
MCTGARAGLISTVSFTNSSSGAKYVDNDEWLGMPDAALFTLGQKSSLAMLLKLSQPQYNPESQVRCMGCDSTASALDCLHSPCHMCCLSKPGQEASAVSMMLTTLSCFAKRRCRQTKCRILTSCKGTAGAELDVPQRTVASFY